MTTLRENEYRLIKALAEAGAALKVAELAAKLELDQSLVMAAGTALTEQALLAMQEQSFEEYRLDKAGQELAAGGLPERAIIKALSEREDLDLERVYQRLTALHWYVKSGSLRILGFRRDPRSVKRIEAVLTDPNTDVRIQAAWALGEIGGEESLALLARLAQDGNNFVRTSAEKALQKASDLKFV